MWTPTYRKFKQTLVSMCRMTSPHGYEPYVWSHLPSPPMGGAPGSGVRYEMGNTQIDRHGNYIVRIPGPGERVMWTAHCDTADNEPKLVNMKWRDDMLMTDGRSILGADDKVGCTIMAMMIRAGCPGTYAFFQGEEVGCLGSSKMSEEVGLLDYDACISLDRKGYGSAITHQCGSRCCSDAWAKELALNIWKESHEVVDFKCDPSGVFTDSAEFTSVIPECTNLSVGYFCQHTHAEKTDVAFAYSLCLALIQVAHKGLVPLPIRDIVNPSVEDEDEDLWWNDYNLSDRGRYRFNSNKPLDPDFMSDNDWKDWKDAL